MKLSEFVSADPRMGAGGWRQELVAGEVRTLPPRDAGSASRAMQVIAALISCIRRTKADLHIEIGGGIGLAFEEGDEFRIADVVVGQPQKRPRPVIVCRVVGDPENPGAEETERVMLYRRCPTLRAILLFAASAPLCRVYRRIGEEWDEESCSGLDAAIRLSPLNGSVFLATAYSDLDAPREG